MVPGLAARTKGFQHQETALSQAKILQEMYDNIAKNGQMARTVPYGFPLFLAMRAGVGGVIGGTVWCLGFNYL